MQSIDLSETYAYEISKDLVCKKEEIKCNNIKTSTKMFNFDYITKDDIKNIIQIGRKFLIINTEY